MIKAGNSEVTYTRGDGSERAIPYTGVMDERRADNIVRIIKADGGPDVTVAQVMAAVVGPSTAEQLQIEFDAFVEETDKRLKELDEWSNTGIGRLKELVDAATGVPEQLRIAMISQLVVRMNEAIAKYD